MSQSNRDHRPERRDRLIQEHVHDPYQSRSKLQEPTFCPQCEAVYRDGRWHWALRPAPAYEEPCPACRRINDKNPAGIVTIGGTFAGQHEGEILGLIRNQEALEKGEHPLHRIMDIDQSGEAIVVTTTDIHLPRRIGEALHGAYRGELNYHYDEASHLIRVTWSRDA